MAASTISREISFCKLNKLENTTDWLDLYKKWMNKILKWIGYNPKNMKGDIFI